MSVPSRQEKTTAPGKSQDASSHGDSPVEMTPLDVSPESATWKDRTPRNIHSDNQEEKADALLDEASDLSFPASDPIAVSSVTRVERKASPRKPQQ